MSLLLGLALVVGNLYAASWYDLEKSKNYQITQPISLRQLGPIQGHLEIMPGESFRLNEIIGLDRIKVSLLQFRYKNCPDPQMKTQMEIITVKNTAPVVEVGTQLEQNCRFEVWIENKDLMTESFFK